MCFPLSWLITLYRLWFLWSFKQCFLTIPVQIVVLMIDATFKWDLFIFQDLTVLPVPIVKNIMVGRIFSKSTLTQILVQANCPPLRSLRSIYFPISFPISLRQASLEQERVPPHTFLSHKKNRVMLGKVLYGINEMLFYTCFGLQESLTTSLNTITRVYSLWISHDRCRY